MTIQDVARHLNVGWDMIKDIQKRHLLKHYAKPKLKHLRFPAVDEISVAKGHRYLTVVLDLESGAVVFVGDGKGTDALNPFFKRLRRSEAKIDAVAVDMSEEQTGEAMGVGESTDITKMTVSQLQVQAKQPGIGIARTKSDFLWIIKEKNSDEDLDQLNGKTLYNRVSELYISRLRTKENFVRLLSSWSFLRL